MAAGRIGRRLERMLLGLGMSLLAFIVERRLLKSLKKKR
jgi:hypothetical protein